MKKLSKIASFNQFSYCSSMLNFIYSIFKAFYNSSMLISKTENNLICTLYRLSCNFIKICLFLIVVLGLDIGIFSINAHAQTDSLAVHQTDSVPTKLTPEQLEALKKNLDSNFGFDPDTPISQHCDPCIEKGMDCLICGNVRVAEGGHLVGVHFKCGSYAQDVYQGGAESGTYADVMGGGVDSCEVVQSAMSAKFKLVDKDGNEIKGNAGRTVGQYFGLSSGPNGLSGTEGARTVGEAAQGFANITGETTEIGGNVFVPEQYGIDNPRSNRSCHIDDLAQKYMKNCYSCVIVSALINTFMRVAYTAEDLMQKAGVKLLVIGMFLWIAFYVLKKLSSFTSLEPMKMLQELFTFFFKCVVAFAFITSGLKVISEYFVNPILIAGADYGIGIIDSVMPENITIGGKTKTYEMDDKINLVAKASVDQKVFDKIMTISKRADAATSLNFVIGNALICHSTHAGAIQLFKKITEMIGIKIFIPDFWLMLAGALIWFFAFMVTMAVNFYLLDLSFKIGFALLALPVCIGLWPFEKFKDKFVICLKIIINAAGTFLFLGITTGLSIVLISKSLHGTDELLERMKADDAEYVSRVFGFTSGAFLLVLFAYLYSHKLISETVSKLADKFFEATTNGLNPMHKMTTQAIDFVKKQAGNVAGMVANPVKGGMTDMMKGGATKLARGAVDKARNGFRSLTGGDE